MLDTEIATTRPDSLPPEDIAAEEALLGGILLDKDAIADVADSLEPRDFYTDSGRKIYEAMLEIDAAGTHPDLITVASRLKAKSQLEEIGGQKRLEELRNCVLTAHNVAAYSALIHETSKRRSLISYSLKLAHLAHDTVKPLGDVIQEVESSLFAITQGIGVKKTRTAKSIMGSVREKFERVCSDGVMPGLTTGFYDLDGMTQGGLKEKALWVICGRPGSGKTAFLLNLAQQVAEKYQKPVQVFSLEMGDEELIHRLWCGLSRVESKYVNTGRVNSEQYDRLDKAEERINNMALLIDEEPGLTLNQIRSRSRQAMKEHGQLGAIMVDYLQIVGGIDDKNRARGLGAVAKGLKDLAKELNVPVIALSQLNREVESRTNKRPTMSDLRDSGEIEEAADLIVGLYREEYYDPGTPDRGIAEVILLKQRSGPTGTVKLLFEPEFTTFRNRGETERYQPPAPKKSMTPDFSGGAYDA